jgi:hypothetical protein
MFEIASDNGGSTAASSPTDHDNGRPPWLASVRGLSLSFFGHHIEGPVEVSRLFRCLNFLGHILEALVALGIG